MHVMPRRIQNYERWWEIDALISHSLGDLRVKKGGDMGGRFGGLDV